MGGIFRANKSLIGGFITGIIVPTLTFLIISYFFIDKNPNGTFDILPIIVTILPYGLINLIAIYNSGVQDATGSDKFGRTGVSMKVNKGLAFGSILGLFIAIFILNNFSFY